MPEQPRKMILGTAGHIDHGKTSLVAALTGVDTDRLPQEKARGITIDIGFAELNLGDYDLGVVDVPGHERFIKNMLAGASGIDIALLVVATDDSVMPQTREHLAILQLLNIEHGVIALTKTDLSDSDWVDLVADDVRELVQGTFLADAPIVKTSATTGLGIDDLKREIAKCCATIAEDQTEQLFRIAVDRAFAVQGLGTVVTGSVWQGEVRPGDEVAWLPSGDTVRVRAIQTHNRSADAATRGQRAAINLINVHHQDIKRGDELAAPGYLKASSLMTARLRVLGDSPLPIKHRQRVRLYLGTQEIMATIALFDENKITAGESAFAQFHCEEPAVASGRQPFVVRAESPLVTIGGGHILQPVADRIARKDRDAIGRLDSLLAGDTETRADTTLFFYGVKPWATLDLCRDADLDPAEAERTIAMFTRQGKIHSFKLTSHRTARVHDSVFENLTKQIATALEKLHAASPLAVSFPREQLIDRVGYLCDDLLLERLIDHMLKKDLLIGSEKRVAAAGSAPKLTKAQKALKDRLKEIYRNAGAKPPTSGELAKQLDTAESNLKPIIELGVVEGDFVNLGDGMYLHTEAEAKVRESIGEALKAGNGMTTSEIRVLLDSTRKYIIPICEYLDSVGFTRRVGDKRVLVQTDADEGETD